MSIQQTATTSFKVQLLQAVHNFNTTGDTFKIALYTADANLGPDTTAYTSANEVVGAGYLAGGVTLVIPSNPTSGTNLANLTTAYTTFNNATWASASFTARAALIYNSSQNNASVAVLDFGSDKTASNDTFQIVFPTADANSAIVRIS